MTDWREQRERKEIRTSASQHKTFDLCPRKWWFEKVRKLPVNQDTGHFVFGTILHEVCERYLEADDLGRDRKTGEPVELYPEDWHITYNKYDKTKEDGRITPAEQDLIKRLVAEGIEAGVLERAPDRKVEHYFRESVIKTEDGTNIQIEGFIDLFYPHQIEDHKTSKSTKWLLSKNKLRKDPQVLIYAYQALMELDKQEEPWPEHITVRHNQYVKDPDRPVVRKTQVEIPVQEIVDFWEGFIIPNSLAMHRLRKETEDWQEIPNPDNMSKACNAYGGCKYSPICSKRENVDSYLKRVERSKDTTYTPLTVSKPANKGDLMSLKEKLAAKRAAQAGASKSSPSVNPPPKEASKPKTAAPEEGKQEALDLGVTSEGHQLVLPPWVDPDNRKGTNGGIGFNEEGSPCKISAMRASREGRPTPDMFDMDVVGDGTVYWAGKEGTPAEGLEGFSPLSLEPQAPVEAQERVQEPDTVPEEPEVEEAQPEPAQEEESSEEEPEQAVKKKSTGGRPKKSFVLVLNGINRSGAQRVGSGRAVHSLNQILCEVQQDIAESQGVESFYEIDVFKRRDLMVGVVDNLIGRFKTDFVYVTGLGTGASDLKTLVDLLLPHAGMVWDGVQH